MIKPSNLLIQKFDENKFSLNPLPKDWSDTKTMFWELKIRNYEIKVEDVNKKSVLNIYFKNEIVKEGKVKYSFNEFDKLQKKYTELLIYLYNKINDKD